MAEGWIGLQHWNEHFTISPAMSLPGPETRPAAEAIGVASLGGGATWKPRKLCAAALRRRAGGVPFLEGAEAKFIHVPLLQKAAVICCEIVILPSSSMTAR